MTSDSESQMAGEQFFSRYETLIKEALERYHIPGFSIAVTDGKEHWSRGYGLSKFPNEKVTSKTIFNVGSMTKALIAAAISFLVDDNEAYPHIHWDTPVSSIIPDFVLADEISTKMVTVEDILSHLSGLPDQDDAILGVGSKTPDTVKSVTQKLRHLPLSYPPRSRFQYCNIMYAVASHLVEHVTGTAIGDFVRQRLWEPLGMKSSYFGMEDMDRQPGAHDYLATGYEWQEEEEETSKYISVPWLVQPEGNGAGEVWSTCDDYMLFILAMLRRSSPISKKAHKKLIKPRAIVSDKPKPFWSQELYALGWEVVTYHGELIISHGGSTTGFGGRMLYLPRKQWGMVCLGNTQDAGDEIADQICWTMIDDLLDVPADQRVDWVKEAMDLRGKHGNEQQRREKYFKQFYPHLPDLVVSTTLPLDRYVRTYTHPGYGTLTVQLKDNKLWIDANDRTYPFTMTLLHASGDFFLAERKDSDTHALFFRKARLRVDESGSKNVVELGIDFVPELKGKDMDMDMIRFTSSES